MGRLIDCNDVYNAIQITTDNFGLIKGVVESNMLTMLSKIETVEAIPKDQYEARLKADMVAILDKIRAEILLRDKNVKDVRTDGHCFFTAEEILEIIDKYKAESEEDKE